MKMKACTILILLIVPLLMACQPEAAEERELPTLAVLPSLTPTDIPTETDVPTQTPTETATATPTATATYTATHTPTTTNTPLPRATATSTLTPSPTATQTPSQTPIPSATPTPDMPQILSFTGTSQSAAPGGRVTLRWTTIADNVRIDQLNQQGIPVQTFPVAANGEIAMTMPTDTTSGLIVYRLVALRGANEVTESFPVTIMCPIPWFFGNEFAPPGSGCPVTLGAIGTAQYQAFERGYMVYVNANNMNRIYGLVTGSNQYQAYNSGYTADAPYLPVPSGFYAPEGHLRWAFMNTNAPIGDWQSALGWGITPLDTSQRTIQFSDNGMFFVDTPQGTVFRFSGGDSGTWLQVK